MGIIHEYEMIKTKLEIQEQAQKNTIQEIHDNIGQILSLAKLHLATLDFAKPEEVVQKTFNSNQLLSRAIKDLRNLTKYLDADHINRIGLSRSLEHELGFLPKDRTPASVLTVTGSSKTLSGEEELVLFRIIQEAVAWFISSSHTSHVSVMIQYRPASVLTSILATEPAAIKEKPDRKDPDIDQIRERSLMIGADLQIDHTNNETIISIDLPLQNY
jgi:two-component system NarL family sensor kinase